MVKDFDISGQELHTVIIDLTFAGLEIKSGDAALSWAGNRQRIPDVSVSDGKLSVVQDPASCRKMNPLEKNVLILNLPFDKPDISFDIALGKGSCILSGIYAGSAALAVSSGNTDIRDSSVDSLSIRIENGNVYCSGIKASDAVIDTSESNIILERAVFEKSLSAISDIGDIGIELDMDDPDPDLDLAARAGMILVNGSGSSQTLRKEGIGPRLAVRTDVGKIDIKWRCSPS